MNPQLPSCPIDEWRKGCIEQNLEKFRLQREWNQKMEEKLDDELGKVWKKVDYLLYFAGVLTGMGIMARALISIIINFK